MALGIGNNNKGKNPGHHGPSFEVANCDLEVQSGKINFKQTQAPKFQKLNRNGYSLWLNSFSLSNCFLHGP